MKYLKKGIIFGILFFPLLPQLLNISELNITSSITSEDEKIEKKKKTRVLQECIKFLNQLEGTALVMRQGEILNYTNLNVLNIHDEKFLPIFTSSKNLEKINYVVFNEYNDPVMSSHFLENILYNPDKSDLIFDYYGWKIFKLGKYKYKFSDYTHFNMSSAQKHSSLLAPSDHTYTYVSYKTEYPDQWIKPRVQDGDFPLLAPGLYDFICKADVEVDCDTKIIMRTSDSLASQQYFYLKKGKNRIIARFLHPHCPFRLLCFSKNKNIIFHDMKISYGWKSKLFSPKNILFNAYNQMPITINSNGEARLSPSSHTKVLIFNDVFKSKETLTYQASGIGTLTIIKVPYYFSHIIKHIRPEKLRFFLLKFMPSQTYALSSRPKTINVSFEEQSRVYIFVKSLVAKNKQDVVFKSLSIRKKK